MNEVIVIGAGIVGLSTAINLAERGVRVLLVDRKGVGAGASFGNGGLVQREAIAPYAFPRDLAEIWTHARRKSNTVRWETAAMPSLAGRLLRYWYASSPKRYAKTVIAQAELIARAPEAHRALAKRSGPEAQALLRPLPWMKVYADPAKFSADLVVAEGWRRDHGVEFDVLDGAEFARTEPHFVPSRVGALRWRDSLSLSDPGELLTLHAAYLERLGGRIVIGDGKTLRRKGQGWAIGTAEGTHEAEAAVIAAGAWSAELTAPFGYRPPVFGKRGYHRHYQLSGGAQLNGPMVDLKSGFLLSPMKRGVRLTTGVEFNTLDAPPNYSQMIEAERVARGLLPLGESVEAEPWMGIRPCTPDMLAILGEVPAQKGLWAAFGHGHQGMTLGPISGEVMADMMLGAPQPDWLAPFTPARFAWAR